MEHRPLHRPLRQPGAISEQLVYPDVLARVELGNPAKRRRLPGRSASNGDPVHQPALARDLNLLGVTERQGDSYAPLVDTGRSPVGSDAPRGVPAPTLPTVKPPGHVALKTERGKPMRWMIVGTMVAVGSLAATAVRAQESDAGMGATATQQSAQADSPAYGAYVSGPATVDADGIPVAKPNPMSQFMDENKDSPPVEAPLVDVPPVDASGSDTDTQ